MAEPNDDPVDMQAIMDNLDDIIDPDMFLQDTETTLTLDDPDEVGNISAEPLNDEDKLNEVLRQLHNTVCELRLERGETVENVSPNLPSSNTLGGNSPAPQVRQVERSLQDHKNAKHRNSEIKNVLRDVSNLSTATSTIKDDSRSPSQMYICDEYKFQTKTEETFIIHKNSHCTVESIKVPPSTQTVKDNSRSSVTYKCDECNFQTKYKRNLPEHKKSHLKSASVVPDDGSPQYKCDRCNYKTLWKGNLHYHQHRYPASHAQCSRCSFVGDDLESVQRHQAAKHPVTRKYTKRKRSSSSGSTSKAAQLYPEMMPESPLIRPEDPLMSSTLFSRPSETATKRGKPAAGHSGPETESGKRRRMPAATIVGPVMPPTEISNSAAIADRRFW